MMYAYDKTYLDKSRKALARMLDFAVYDLNYNLVEFWQLFLKSDISKKFGYGDFTLLVGKSGVELTYDVLESNEIRFERVEPRYSLQRSEEYWTGWALAYYQWDTSLSFSQIQKAIPIQDIVALYDPYHEMDIRQFCDKMNELYKEAMPFTNLKRIRLEAGLTQNELSKLSGISMRSIQQYEQRQKDINNAKAETLIILARALYCDAEDLIEKVR